MGPFFIKIGQLLATRSDILSKAFIKELSFLRDKSTPFAFKSVRKIILKEFGGSIEELFSHFEEKPIASASVAQVHKAKTKSGLAVAVKILKPNIKKSFKSVEKFLFALLKCFNFFFPRFSNLKLLDVHKFIFRLIFIEIDLRIEAANASKFKQDFDSSCDLYIPNVFWELTSETVLTTEWIDGVNLNTPGIKLGSSYAKRIINIFLKQVCLNGFFHGDMHAGNFMLLDNKICLVDFGIVGYLDKALMFYILETLSGFAFQDYARVSDAHFDSGYIDSSKYSKSEFETACRSIGEKIVNHELNKIKISELLSQLFSLAVNFDMQTQIPLLLLQKNTLLLEDLLFSICPKTNLWEYTRLWLVGQESRFNKMYCRKKIIHLMKIRRVQRDIKDVLMFLGGRKQSEDHYFRISHFFLFFCLIMLWKIN